ncbi:MAG: MoaD/ThiS family protein [Candidatus Bathyarchaeia archaeon]
MIARVRFFGDLQDYVRKSWTTIEVKQGSTILDLIQQLAEKVDSDLPKKIIEGGKTRPEIKILLNGRDIAYMNGLMTELNDHDLVSFLPIAGGG